MWPHYLLTAANATSPGSGLDPAWVTAALALTAAVMGCIAWGLRWGWRVLTRITRFLDDYFGEPARQGVPERPGVMTRLQCLTDEVAKVRAQVIPNGGSSLRDAVDKLSADVALVAADLTGHRQATTPAISRLGDDLAELRRRLELFEAERAGREGAQ